ncbi:MAG: carboxypeptidase-like regulatory domain-containing protein, partial [Acidobacteria bacterium]|nr:carboxypeptidase-like regulatory domain-containing protein [Acidobacteriota bacterium]
SVGSGLIKNNPDTITGTLQGRVVDSGGLPLADVRVRAINEETGNVRSSRTNAEGWYQINLLPLGFYRVDTLKEGFQVVTRAKEPIKVQLNKTVQTLPDIVLGPVTATPAPTVATTQPPATPAPPQAQSPLPSAEDNGKLTNQVDSTRRSNSDERMVTLLPLAAVRSFDDLALLAAGVAPPPQVKGVAGPGIGAGIGTAGQFSVNGQRARSNNFTVDGSDNNDEDVGVRRQGFVALVPQSVESVKEIQIVTNLWDAEQGRSVGSQVNAVSKSGTNFFHGQLYDFFNHSSLNARNFFDYSAKNAPANRLTALAISSFSNGQPIPAPVAPIRPVLIDGQDVILPNPSQDKDQYQRNQGGVALGFPIVRNNTFFFGSFERQDIKARQETHFSTPTITQRGFLGFGATGILARDNAGNSQTLNPTSTAGDAVFSLFPFPNNPVGPYGENTFTQVAPADAHATIYSLKLDHNFKLFGPEITHAFTAKYNFTDDERQVPAVGGAIFSGVVPKVRTQNLSLFLNSQLSPTKANQLRASYGRTALTFDETRDPNLIQSSLLPNEKFLLNAPLIGNFASPAFPIPFVDYRRITGFDSEGQLSPIGQVVIHPFSPVGLDVYLFPQARVNNTIQVADTLSYFRANHAYKFGFDIRRTQLNSFLNRNYRPQVVFGGSPDLTSLFNNAPIQNISQFGPTPGFFSGADLAALGIPTGIFQALAIGAPDSTIGLRFWQLNFFANDNWRARRGLTLDYGLRYEVNTVPREVNSRIENTFGLSQLPPADPNLAIAAPFTGGRVILSNQDLLNSFNATTGALRNQIGNRDNIFDLDRNNLGGHIGFAWDPFATNTNQAGKTSIRGGVGAYYDLALGSVVSQSRNVFPTFLPFNVDVNTFAYAQDFIFQKSPGSIGIIGIFNPRFFQLDIVNQGVLTPRRGLITPDNLNGLNAPAGVLPQLLGLLFDPSVAGSPRSGGGIAFTLPDNDLRSPYTLQYNLQIERELYPDFLVNLAYVGARGVKLTRFRTPNGGPNSITLPIDPLALTPNPVFAIALPPLSDIEGNRFSRPNPLLGAYTIFDSSAASTYHSFQATATKRFSRGYQFGAAYTWSHAIDDVSDVFDVAGAFVLPQDDRALNLERGDANFDVRHRFVLSSTGNLPFLHRYNDDKGAAGFLLGGWQYATFMTYQTGQPYTVNTSYDINMDGNLTDRLDTLNGLSLIEDRRRKLQLTTNPSTLLAALGANGRIGRNFFRANGVANTDLAVIKNFNVREGQFVMFRFEAFNLFNRTHFAIPVRILESPSFGQSIDTLLNPRQIQFALKYVF